MKFLVAVGAIAASVMLTSAQDLSALPECARACIVGNLPQECSFDQKCICESKKFTDESSCCVLDACSEEDVKITTDYATETCSSLGVTPQPAADCATGGNSSSTTGGSTESNEDSSNSSEDSSDSSDDSSSSSGSSSTESAAAAGETNGAATSYVASGFGAMAFAAVGAAALL